MRFQDALKKATYYKKRNRFLLSISLTFFIAVTLAVSLIAGGAFKSSASQLSYRPASNFQSAVTNLMRAEKTKNPSLIAASEAQLEVVFIHLPRGKRQEYLQEALSVLNQANQLVASLTVEITNNQKGAQTVSSGNEAITGQDTNSQSKAHQNNGKSESAPGQLKNNSFTTVTPNPTTVEQPATTVTTNPSNGLSHPTSGNNPAPQNTSPSSQPNNPSTSNSAGNSHTTPGSNTIPTTPRGNAYGKTK